MQAVTGTTSFFPQIRQTLAAALSLKTMFAFNFMGMELDGSRSFKIDTTDIHDIESGQIVRVHHLEDWATGIKQLKA